jgi:SAM-dependent methyltransferase
MAAGRWEVAQQYEKGYWLSRAQELSHGGGSGLDFYKWRADQLVDWIKRLGLGVAGGNARVLEVGSGPVGLASFFPAARQLIVDPLESEYSRSPELVALRNPKAEYRTALGEKLPAADGEFDLAVIENCIDHVRDPYAVIREIRRTLKPGGILYITVNCRSRSGYYVHRVLSRLRLDPGHPYTFTPDRLARLLEREGFAVIDTQVGSYEQAKQEDLASGSSRARLKARLGVSEYITAAIARRKD